MILPFMCVLAALSRVAAHAFAPGFLHAHLFPNQINTQGVVVGRRFLTSLNFGNGAARTTSINTCHGLVRRVPSGLRGVRACGWEPGLQNRLESCRKGAPERCKVLLGEVQAPLQRIYDAKLEECGVELWLKRDDMIHSAISGNKWRKLKYNTLEAVKDGYEGMLTFGGAFSNHIAATAEMGALCGLGTIGVIRGEEVDRDNPTLRAASQNGMRIVCVSRARYRDLTRESSLRDEHLSQLLGEIEAEGWYVVPEGGANVLGLCGCSEALDEVFRAAGMGEREDGTSRGNNGVGCGEEGGSGAFDLVTAACGTGTTLAGLAANTQRGCCEIMGFPALKGGGFILDDVRAVLKSAMGEKRGAAAAEGVCLSTEYHFGGYAKTRDDLISFLRTFYNTHGVRLDPVYTGKMMYGIYDMAKKGRLKDRKVLAVHTGGLQGIQGIEATLGEKIF